MNDKCYPFNYRENGKYCDIEKEFVSQLEKGENCDNNFECEINLCIDQKCVSGSLWAKIFRWLSRIFG